MSNEMYAIVCHYTDYVSIAVAQSHEVALRDFLQAANLVIDLYPDAEVKFLGQDIDGGMPSLALTLEGQVMVTLQQPEIVDGKIIQDGNMVDAPAIKLPGIDAEHTYSGIAVWLDWAYQHRDPEQAYARMEQALNSFSALHLSRDYAQLLPAIAEESAREVKLPRPKGKPAGLRSAIDAIRLSHSMMTPVR